MLVVVSLGLRLAHPVSEDIAATFARLYVGGIGPTHPKLTDAFVASGFGDAAPYDEVTHTPNKEIRVRRTIQAAVRRPARARQLIDSLLRDMRACGHFHDSPVPTDVIGRAQSAFRKQGWVLSDDGELTEVSINLDTGGRPVGTAVRFLRARGYERIVLLGFSGGASLLCFYQAQAEHLTATELPDGRASGLAAEQLPPADRIVLFGHHLGRSQTMRNVLDAAVLDERELTRTDPSLDVFDPDNGPPFSEEFLARVRTGQSARMDRITNWVQERLAELQRLHGPEADEAFVVHRTNADPYMFDEHSDFAGNNGAIRDLNFSANGLGRFSTLRSWLSQWATGISHADGPSDLARTTVPVLSIVQQGDHRAHPDYLRQWEQAMGDRFTGHHRFEAAHYMNAESQSAMIEELADLIAAFATDGT